MTKNFIKTAVIGHPISHSKSPLIHNYWLDLYGLSGSYKAIDIASDNLKQGVADLVNQGYSGFNVTVPHKADIMALCDEIDDLAEAIGAVNTVSIKEGRLYGTNTDAYGFAQNIKETVKLNNWGWSFNQGKALVLGAGGAAKAVTYALIQEGVQEIIITNRTREKAEELAKLDNSKISVADWNNRSELVYGTNLVVNTTSLGMVGKPPLEIDLSLASKATLVTDIVYAPLYTDLLEQAKAKDLRVVTGIGMLLHQARPAFKLWNGVMPEVTAELERLVLK